MKGQTIDNLIELCLSKISAKDNILFHTKFLGFLWHRYQMGPGIAEYKAIMNEINKVI